MKKIKMLTKVVCVWRAMKNAIAWVFFWYLPTCPNCGDSSAWKSFRSPIFRIIGNQDYQFQACQECLSDSRRLKPEKIRKNLSERGWPSEAIVQVILCMFTGEATVIDETVISRREIAEPAVPAAETFTFKEPVPA